MQPKTALFFNTLEFTGFCKKKMLLVFRQRKIHDILLLILAFFVIKKKLFIIYIRAQYYGSGGIAWYGVTKLWPACVWGVWVQRKWPEHDNKVLQLLSILLQDKPVTAALATTCHTTHLSVCLGIYHYCIHFFIRTFRSYRLGVLIFWATEAIC